VSRIVPIVEGHGERHAVPALLRRISAELGRYDVEIPEPIRIPRQRLPKEGELERAATLATYRCDPESGILVLVDADGDCPATTAQALMERARGPAAGRPVRVVLAKNEFESWFVAAAESIGGQRGLRTNLAAPADPEAIRDAKGWLTRHCPGSRSYRPSRDQPALVELFDLDLARQRAPSFDKLVRDVAALLGSDRTGGGSP